MTRRLWALWSGAVATARRAVEQVRDDIETDPYLLYLLGLAALLAVAWTWHGLPAFATRDERWRVLDPVRPVGFFLDDPGFDSVRDGLTYWRSYGGTFYLYGLVLLPVVAFVIVTGNSPVLVEMAAASPENLWEHWNAVPSWVWTAVILPARLVNAAFAVGSVYVLYRLGTVVRDRATGRLAALLLSLTWGLLVLAHEAGEDVPALFFFLLAVYFAVEYVDSGSRRAFCFGCLSGGLATGLKLSAGVSALLIGVAYLSRARRADRSWPESLVDPRLLAAGLAVGGLAVLFSYPQTLVGAFDQVGGRVSRGVSGKGSPHSWMVAPGWWWLLRGYLNGLGLPLALAAVGGVGGALGWVHESSRVGDASRLTLVALVVFLGVYSQWAYVRTHHLLLTFPLLALLVAIGVSRLAERRDTIARVAVVALVVSTGAYAIGGDLGYASEGRDRAADWMRSNIPADATVETYVRDPQESAVPHGLTVTSLTDPERIPDVESRCPEYVVLGVHRSLMYPAPATHSDRAASFSDPAVSEYVGDLLRGDTLPYEVVATFGRQPRFLDGHRPRPDWWRMLRVGIRPRTIQYGDPQDLGTYQYTVVLEETGSCGDVVI